MRTLILSQDPISMNASNSASQILLMPSSICIALLAESAANPTLCSV